MRQILRCFPLLCCVWGHWAALAHAQAPAGASRPWDAESSPYAYGLRLSLMPLTFHAGISQSRVGASGALELDVLRILTVGADIRLPYANVAGLKRGFSVEGGAVVHFHLLNEVAEEPLVGSVYPQDVPPVAGSGLGGTDQDLIDIPVNQKLGGPRLLPPERDTTLRVAVRNVHSVRLGYRYLRSVQAVPEMVPTDGASDPPSESVEASVPLLNRMHALSLGYGFGQHWNLVPSQAAGRCEVGWKRYYVDLLVTFDGLVETNRLGPQPSEQADLITVGARLGLAGSTLGGDLEFWRGLGLAYRLELGLLPGKPGLEGYLFLGLGAQLDFAVP